MKTGSIITLTQTLDQLERLNSALAALRRELLPAQPRKFAILAESPLEDMRRLHLELERLTAAITVGQSAGADLALAK